MNSAEIMKRLESLVSHDPKDLAGMARFGINVDKAWVISIPKLRGLAREIKSSVIPAKAGIQREKGLYPGSQAGMTKEALHQLALQIWDTGIHEAKIFASMIDDPKLVTEDQMEKWVLDFDSWDVTDQVCGNLFDRTPFAVRKAIEWSARSEDFVKRAGFVLMAGLATHDKTMLDAQFLEFLTIIKRESGDNRNFVRNAVNWALRTIGKGRNEKLYRAALTTSTEILRQAQNDKTDSARAMRFVAGDAIRELQKDYIKNRFGIK